MNIIMETAIALWDWLKGKKTYILSLALVVFAVTGVVTGHLTLKEAIELIFGAGISSTIRQAIE